MTKTKNKRHKKISYIHTHPVAWSEANIEDCVYTTDPQESNPGMETRIKVRVCYSDDKRPTNQQIAKAAKDAIRRLFRGKGNV